MIDGRSSIYNSSAIFKVGFAVWDFGPVAPGTAGWIYPSWIWVGIERENNIPAGRQNPDGMTLQLVMSVRFDMSGSGPERVGTFSVKPPKFGIFPKIAGTVPMKNGKTSMNIDPSERSRSSVKASMDCGIVPLIGESQK